MLDSPSEAAWYRQFWPWVLIVLPGTVVIASFVTLYIAIVNSHSMVKDDYYKDGLAINKYLHEDKLAREMDLTAQVIFSPETNQISLELHSKQPVSDEHLILAFIDPVDSSSDFDVPVQLTANGSYQQSLLKLDMKRWYLQLSPANTSNDQRWRLRGEIDLEQSHHTTMASTPIE